MTEILIEISEDKIIGSCEYLGKRYTKVVGTEGKLLGNELALQSFANLASRSIINDIIKDNFEIVHKKI